MRCAPDVVTQTTSESNFYEELLVNPVLLGLAAQRGHLDCGGLRYMAIGYGDFVQLILPMLRGHLSAAVSRSANVNEIARRIHAILEAYGRSAVPLGSWVIA